MDLRDLRGFELDVPGIIDLFGLDRLVKTAGEEKVIESIGKEEALAVIFPSLTREQIRELLDKNGVAQKESGSN